MTSAVLTEKKTVGDVVRHEYREDYCRVGAPVYNRSNGALTITDPMGYPLVVDESVAGAYQFANATGAANVVGLLIRTKPYSAVADNAVSTERVLVRGPAIIDKAQLPTVDYAAAGFTLATLVTALTALGIICHPEQAVVATQSE